MEIDEEILADEPKFSYLNYISGFIGFIQNNGWYVLALVTIFIYFIVKLWPHYLKWSERRSEAAYEAEIKKNPDLFKQKEDEMKKARIKFQEEYEKKAKIALEKQKEKEKRILEEKQELLKHETTGQSINSSRKPKKPKPDYNPLMGSGSSSNYRPPRRSPCSGGGCG